MLARIRKSAEEKDQGFTLIELLVVIIIIGILAAIAIPVFLNQRQKGYKADMKSVAKNAATAVESYATETNGDYSALNGTDATVSLEGFHISNAGQTVALETTVDVYCITVSDARLAGVTFLYDSSVGAPVENGTCSV
jgi:type IV pilus assembly protein PilA